MVNDMRALALRLVLGTGVLVALLDLAASAAPPAGRLDRAAEQVAGHAVDRPQALALGLGLLVLAGGIAGRRRLAMWVSIAALALTTAAALPHRPVRAAASGTLVVVLVALHEEFATRPDGWRTRP